MSARFRVVAFDADDTLWHTEPLFTDTQERFRALLGRFAEEGVVEQRLSATQVRNLSHYGYGVKSFTLSMIETAIDLTDGRIGAAEIGEILRMGREMLLAPVDVFEPAEDVLQTVGRDHELMLITKGDLLDQETKLARSGLGDLFRHVEIVSRKDRATYEGVLQRHAVRPEDFLMVGDSLRSDVLPVAEMGAWAVHVPSRIVWAHERVAEAALEGASYRTADGLADVPGIIAELEAG